MIYWLFSFWCLVDVVLWGVVVFKLRNELHASRELCDQARSESDKLRAALQKRERALVKPIIYDAEALLESESLSREISP